MLQQTKRPKKRSVMVHSKYLKIAQTLAVVLNVLSLSSIALGASLPDFTIAPVDIRFSTENPVEGESVTITVFVSNKGGESRDDIEVRFFEATPDEWGLQIEKGDVIIGLGSGQRNKADVKWRAKAGSNDIYVVVDPDNTIAEANETNNQAHRTITCKALTLPKPSQTEIEAAIQKGLNWLRTQQGELYVLCPDGHENPSIMVSFGNCMICRKPLTESQMLKKDNLENKGGWNPIIGPGATALALMAFLHAGVSESDQAVADGIDYLLHHAPVPNWEEWNDSYDFAAGILALQATGNKEKYLEKVTYATERILKMQTYGGWGYGAYPDMAHMQYVMFALYAAPKWGIEIPEETFKQVADWVRSMQREDGGWSYGGTDVGSPWAASSYGSMTATALMIFKICGIPTTDPQFQKGLEWLKRHYTVTSNPGAHDWDYYYILALQRAMTIPPEQPLIGERNWYEEAAAYLLSQQRPDGSWEAGAQEAAIMATPFAILFLTKAIPSEE
ncbi:hypothetical protein H8E77_10610 [bacterium]|nr:hypothetical protein [bacterium]